MRPRKAAGSGTSKKTIRIRQIRSGIGFDKTQKATLRALDALADRHRNLAGLAGGEADPAVPVPHDDESGKGEVLPALDDLRHAVDVDDAIFELAHGVAIHVGHVILLRT